uniref:Uncharacterized protein n=1 Tax=Anguilla anguilla TaxID=7936 RepID=A0A0E9PKC1_ANGAN
MLFCRQLFAHKSCPSIILPKIWPSGSQYD